MNRRSAARLSLAILVATFGLSISPTPSPASDLLLLALVGEVAPDSGGQTIEWFLQAPAFSKTTPEVAFDALLSGGPDSSAVYLHNAGVTTLFAISGDTDPITGTPYVAVAGPRYWPGGDFYFWADVVFPGLSDGMIRVEGSVHTPFHRIAGLPVPDVAGATFGTDYGPPFFNASGDFAFASQIYLTPRSFRGVSRSTNGVIETLVLNGDSAPGTGGGVFLINPFEPALDSSGGVYFRSAVVGGAVSNGLFRASDSEVTPFLLSGDPAPGTGGATFQSFRDPVIDSQGALHFVAVLSGGTSTWGIFRSRQGEVEPVVLSGDPVPGTGGGRFGSNPWGRVVLTDTGAIVFQAGLVDGTSSSGLFGTFGGSAFPIALEGDLAPGVDGARFISFDPPTVGPNGRVGVLAGLNSIQHPSALYVPEPDDSLPALLVLTGSLFLVARTRLPRTAASTSPCISARC